MLPLKFAFILFNISLIWGGNQKEIMTSDLVKFTEQFVSKTLLEKTPANNFYHNINHSKEVVQAVIEISKGENLTEEETNLVVISAWFHDIGYTIKREGHEELSAKMASEFLTQQNLDTAKINIVVGCILSTKVPQQPKTLLQKVLCDADLYHLGKKNFFVRNDLYRKEVESIWGKMKDADFIGNTIKFANAHTFFTNYAIKNFSAQKAENIKELKSQLEKLAD